MVARARAVQQRWWSGLVVATDVELDHAAARLADNLKICSCPMCCGRRRRIGGGPTRAERRHQITFIEALVDR